MPKFTLKSSKFTGISLNCPERPETGDSGSYFFPVNSPVLVTHATMEAIEDQFSSFPPSIQRAFTLQVEVSEDAKSETPSEPKPLPPPSKDDPEWGGESEELIAAEVAKLLEKTIAEGKPILQKTSANPDFPLALRIAYLESVSTDPRLQKGLQEYALELHEDINGDN
jgi:hypothetical protein